MIIALIFPYLISEKNILVANLLSEMNQVCEINMATDDVGKTDFRKMSVFDKKILHLKFTLRNRKISMQQLFITFQVKFHFGIYISHK